MNTALRFFTIIGLFLATVVFTVQRYPDLPKTQQHPQRSGAMEAMDFWTGARAYPSNDIAKDKYFKAHELNKKLKKQHRAPFSSLPGWTYIGPDNLAGRMISVTLNPQNPNTIYAGSASGGLWRSHTGGVAGDWHRVSTGYPVLGVGAIEISPADSNTMYIGTGEVYRYGGSLGGLVIRTTRGSYGVGILKTTDGGNTWTKSLDWTYNQQTGVQSIKINPLNPNTVWAATSEGIYKSTNAGATWTQSFFIYMGTDIVIHSVDTNKVMFSAGNLNLNPVMFRTSDGGSNWELINPAGFTGKTLLDSPPSYPDIVYASIADSTTGVASLWKSSNFGTTWAEMTNNTVINIFGVQGWYSHYVAVHPEDTNTVFVGAVSAAKSTNGGVSFTGVSGLYSDNHDFAYHISDPNILYSANDDGIYRSTNFGQSFTDVSDNLGTGQLYNGLSNSATDSLLALVQSQDHIPGYLYNGSTTWPRSAADESGWTAIDPSNDNLMYAVTRFGQSVRRSTNRGVSFPLSTGFGSLGAWNSPIVISPSNPSIIYFGKSRIFKTTNAGGSWAATNGNLELDGNPALAMAMSSTDPDTVYVGMAPLITNAHMFRTTDGGLSWTNITGTLPDRYPLDLAVDPDNSQIVYAGFGGFGTGHIFKSTNSGGSWSDITGSLPDIPVTAVLVDPQNSNVVYIGTDVGVHVSTNGGTTWNPFDEGLPEAVLVSDLSMTPSNRTIRVGTHGNGAFERKMPNNLPFISDVIPSGGEAWEIGSVQTISWEQAVIPSVKIEYTTDNGATWNLIENNVSGASTGYQWTIPPTVTSQARVKITSLADTTITSQSTSTFSIFINGVVLSVYDRWNLVSLPVTVPDPSTAAVFPGATSNAFSYQTSYVSETSLEEGKGYWLKYGADQSLPVQGSTITGDTIPVQKDWNLIGSLTDPIDVSSITSNPPGIITTSFYAYDGSYSTADSIRPGSGYWVKTSSAGTLVLSSSASAKPNISTSEELDRLNKLTITDANGNIQKLYFGYGSSLQDVQRHELPPLPPAGGFDARFESQRLVTIFDESHPLEVPLQLTSARFPVAINWTVIAEAPTAELVINGKHVALQGTGSASIEHPASNIVLKSNSTISGAGVPHTFALHQNYPNPFNPSTEIRYDVAEEGNVRITIYSLLGEEIAAIVNEQKAPGSYSIRWDASNLPGGIYFSRLAYGNQTISRKMLLMK